MEAAALGLARGDTCGEWASPQSAWGLCVTWLPPQGEVDPEIHLSIGLDVIDETLSPAFRISKTNGLRRLSVHKSLVQRSIPPGVSQHPHDKRKSRQVTELAQFRDGITGIQ